MNTPHAPVPGEDTLQSLRELLARLDPASEVLVDASSGEVLVRGDIDPAQLDAAMREAGLGMCVADVDVADAAGGDCCGGCG